MAKHSKFVSTISKYLLKRTRIFRFYIPNGMFLVLAMLIAAAGIFYFSYRPTSSVQQPKKPIVISEPTISKPAKATTATPNASSTSSGSSTSFATVPQTVSNNTELALHCSNAQGAYDTAAVQVEQATESAIQGIEAQASSETISQEVAQENQVYSTSNASLSQDYSLYTSAVNAIPGCAIDFQPTVYPMATVPND